jgi:hypothetical protein
VNTYDTTYSKLVSVKVGGGSWLETSKIYITTRYGTVLEVGSLTVAA